MCNQRLVIVPMAVPGDSRQGTQQHKLVYCQSLESEFFHKVLYFDLFFILSKTNLKNHLIELSFIMIVERV